MNLLLEILETSPEDAATRERTNGTFRAIICCAPLTGSWTSVSSGGSDAILQHAWAAIDRSELMIRMLIVGYCFVSYGDNETGGAALCGSVSSKN
jgi:hypothetical protein